MKNRGAMRGERKGKKKTAFNFLNGDASLRVGFKDEAVGAGPDRADRVLARSRRDTLELSAVNSALACAST